MKKLEENNKIKVHEKNYSDIIWRNSERIPIKKIKKIAKTFFYKKITKTNIFGKTSTLIDRDKPKKKKNKKGKKTKKEIIQKTINESSEKKYLDSTFLAQDKKEEK